MELMDPPETVARGTFHSRYVVPKDAAYRHHKTPRLGDCLLCVAPHTDPDYFESPGAGEFAVVDVVTKEKAWFDMPADATPEIITGMIESHFAATAYRVGPKVWFV